jgi:hypothetical protein
MSELISYAFQFFDENPIMRKDTNQRAYPEADGVVWYEVMLAWPQGGEEHIKLMQLFRKGVPVPGHPNIWQWDGDKENPTITPSFHWVDGGLHLFVRHGALDILPDTTVKCDSVRRRAKIDWDDEQVE